MTTPASQPARRRLFLDWARGLAVLCMIEHHHFDAFMPEAFHGTPADRLFRFLGGAAAPTFLFLSGLALVLLMEGRLRRSGDRAEAARAAAVRGFYIFLGAYAFRFQEWALAGGASPASSMLRIDVLNCIGVALVATALLWHLGGTAGRRAALFVVAAALASGLTPPIWHADLSSWPQLLADYVNGRSPRALFPLFPWIGYAFAGAAVGLAFAHTRREEEGRLVAALALGAAAVWLLVRLIDAQPFRLYAQSEWWVDSPAYFLFRCASEAWLIAACWAVEKLGRPLWARLSPGPLLQLGRHSLIVYWVHVELVYGRFSWRLRGTLSLPQAAVGLALLLAAMVALSYSIDPLKQRLSALGARLPPQPT